MPIDLLTRNRAGSKERHAGEPDQGTRLAALQTPGFFWIGCSDGRVPPNVVAGLDPDEVLAHRNVDNSVHASDLNLLSALEFAVNARMARASILCGHVGCGGGRAVTDGLPQGLADHWVGSIRRLARCYAVALRRRPDMAAPRDRLARLNVAEGVRRGCNPPILRGSRRRGADLRLHGLLYGLKDGGPRDLDWSIRLGHFQIGHAGRETTR